MKILRSLCMAAMLLVPPAAKAAPVLMISIDGLQPADVLEADKRGIKVPALLALAAEGAYATGVRNALPTITYPNHTTLLTGVWPARHGIAGNQTFDPLQQNLAGWYWYAGDIKVPTLWDAVHAAGGKVASLSWPVSAGARSIDYNVPEYWRAHIPEDLKLVEALSTPGLVADLQKATGLDLGKADGETVAADIGRTRYAAALIAARHPAFTTVHLRGLDHVEHESGPDSPQAKAALEQLDAAVGRLVAEARKTAPGITIVIVSDHGFAPVHHDVNLLKPFIAAGLITPDAGGRKAASWLAAPWGGASVAVVLARPGDAALKRKVAALLDKLAADPVLGIAHIADAAEIARAGGTPMASFWVDFKPGYEMGQDPAAPLLSPGSVKGTHGYMPTHPEMRASFIAAGPGVPKKGSLDEIDMRDIAPTLAKILDVKLPAAEGHPLF